MGVGVGVGVGGWVCLHVCMCLACMYFVCVHMLKPFVFSVLKNGQVYMLDLAAKLDQTAEFICKKEWGDIVFPPPFGRDALPEVSHAHVLAHRAGV